ncbi:MAG: SxtJ family membrane protein, partial [Gammaproteobacteria bacterium]|nr:SxtJ family membrane protein [Gammaproteobacteria bacterium]
AIISVLFGLLLPWLFEARFPVWPWVIALVVALWALAAPASLRVGYTAWMRLGLLLNRVTSPILLGLIYFALFTPVAVCLKLLRRDLLSRSVDANATSYRVEAEKDDIQSNLKNPY